MPKTFLIRKKSSGRQNWIRENASPPPLYLKKDVTAFVAPDDAHENAIDREAPEDAHKAAIDRKALEDVHKNAIDRKALEDVHKNAIDREAQEDAHTNAIDRDAVEDGELVTCNNASDLQRLPEAKEAKSSKSKALQEKNADVNINSPHHVSISAHAPKSSLSQRSAFQHWTAAKNQIQTEQNALHKPPNMVMTNMQAYTKYFSAIDVNNNNSVGSKLALPTALYSVQSAASSVNRDMPECYGKMTLKDGAYRTNITCSEIEREHSRLLCSPRTPYPFYHPYTRMQDLSPLLMSPHLPEVSPTKPSLPFFPTADKPTPSVIKSSQPVTHPTSLELINGGYGIKNPILSPAECHAASNPSTIAERFCCKVCHKVFEFPKHLQRHMKVHGDIKRYLCTFCGKGFNDTFDLKRHTRTHTGVRPYKCERCDKSFTQRCSLESHCRKIHNLDFKYGYKERRGKIYVCEDCGHVTHDPEEHFFHIKEVHPYNPVVLRCFDKRQFKFNGEIVN